MRAVSSLLLPLLGRTNKPSPAQPHPPEMATAPAQTAAARARSNEYSFLQKAATRAQPPFVRGSERNVVYRGK